MNDKVSTIFKDGLLYKNPIFAQLLGICSTLAITTSVLNGLSMGISVTIVLICSNVLISLLRNIIPKNIRIAAYIVIISAFVTSIELLIKAFLPALDESLGLFIPLIVVNCLILARAEAFASKNPPLLSALDGLSMGTGYTLALILISTVREILGNGTFFGLHVMPESYSPALIFILPSGAFITLGFILAGVNALTNKFSEKNK